MHLSPLPTKYILYATLIALPIIFILIGFSSKYHKNSKIRKCFFIGFGIFVAGLEFYYNRIHRFDLQLVEHQITLPNNNDTNNAIKKPLKIAIFADIHIGLFKDKEWVQTVVEKINSIDKLDLVLVPGDWILHAEKTQFLELFSPLKQIKVPVFGVMGNHDIGSDEPENMLLRQGLEQNGVQLIDDVSRDLTINGHSLRLIGVLDRWRFANNVNVIRKVIDKNSDENSPDLTLAIAHNPDSVRDYRYQLNSKEYENLPPLMTVTGHTHCGQVRLPWLYRFALPVLDGYYDKGFYQEMNAKEFKYKELQERHHVMKEKRPSLFITCGVGEVGLPFRFNNAPTIDVLTFQRVK